MVKPSRTLTQVSAGGVVFKRLLSGVRVCLIARRRGKQLIWCLPKGHIEKGESLRRTALREVREETGISGTVLSPLGVIRYSFFDPETKRRVSKSVHFFLIQYLKGKLTDHDEEVEEARWFPVSKVFQRAEYRSEYQILKKAARKLEQLT